MNEVVNGIDFAFIYINDILVADKDEKSHEIHLGLIFERLEKYGLTKLKLRNVFSEQTHYITLFPKMTFFLYQIA